ncbi:MAG: carboxypeptidase-like regulatory domain-containing protein [Acidimicrobiia bacterium]
MRRFAYLIAIALVLSACSSEMDLTDRDQNANTTTSTRPIEQGTIAGLAQAGPTCPVQTDPPDPACADRPVAGAVLLVLDRAGHEVDRAVTNPDGRFSIPLPPGTYRIVPQPVEGLLGTADPLEVQVVAAGTESVTLGYDTGIR